MTTINEITGDKLQTKVSSQSYRDNWAKIFAKKTIVNAVDLIEQGSLEVAEGVWVMTQEAAIAEQDLWDEEDKAKSIDLTAAPIWLMAGWKDPIAFYTVKEVNDYLEVEGIV